MIQWLNSRSCLLIASVMSALSAPCFAQSYPEKPIRLLLPYETGAFPDIVARLVGGKVGDAVGQRVLVENRVGASGSVGTLAVVKSPADGYTLLAVINNHATNPYLFKNLPYDRFSDLAPISLMVRGPWCWRSIPSWVSAIFRSLSNSPSLNPERSTLPPPVPAHPDAC